MKVLILGGSGMLGHKLWQVLTEGFDVHVTVRRPFDSYSQYGLFDQNHTVDHVSAEAVETVVDAIDTVRPTVVVNCIGIVKQVEAARDPVTSITVNALFPHRLAQLCVGKGIRLIHISTDCVFSGRRGGYLESDATDAEDLYGKTKVLGEVTGEGCLTLRTSMIGRELDTSHGLIEWFLSQEGKTVGGYRKAIFSGLTTIALSEIIARIMSHHPDLQGLYHVASEPISKFALLSMVKDIYGLDIRIEPDEAVVCDRSLNGERFRQAIGRSAIPGWPDMIRQMYHDPTPYSQLRRLYAKQ